MDTFEINFIPGKGLSTKSIQDGVISAHFEVPANLNAQKYVNRVIELHIKGEKVDLTLDANLASEGNSYYYSSAHKNWCVKLDIALGNILIIGYLLDNQYKKSISLPTNTES